MADNRKVVKIKEDNLGEVHVARSEEHTSELQSLV